MAASQLTKAFLNNVKREAKLPSVQFTDADLSSLLAGAEFLEMLFPHQVLVLCKVSHTEVKYVGKNSHTLLGYEYAFLQGLSAHKYFELVHPDDSEQITSCYNHMQNIKDRKGFLPEEYKFVFHYRLKTPRGFMSVVDEKNSLVNKSGLYLHFSLLQQDASNSPPVMDVYKWAASSFNLVERYLPTATKSPVTAREHEIITLISKGLTNKEIGAKLFISASTVKNHRSNLFIKTKTRNVVELMNYATRHALIPLG